MPEHKIAIFEGKRIRRHWDTQKELWFFSVVDIVAVLTDSSNPRKYWNKLAGRLRKEGNESVTKCHQLKMRAVDGKNYLTDAADTETMLRIIQSIPSPNAEPFKLWLARVGYERLEETADPELAINRALKTYLQKGYSHAWVNQRLKSIEVRKALTDEWETRGVKEGLEFAILTNEITKAWTGLTTKQYKNLKGLKKENLRDNMTNLELVLNMLAETATTEISQKRLPKNFPENKVEIYQKFGVPPNLQEHMLRVAGIAMWLRNHWRKEPVDWELITQACLLHDLGNIVKFTSFTGMKWGTLAYWQDIQKQIISKYGTDDHEATKKMLLEIGADQKIIDIIAKKSFGNSLEVEKSRNWPLKIVYYADLRALPSGVGSLADRMADVKKRLPKYANRPDFDDLVAASRKVEQDLQSKLRVSVDVITDKTIKIADELLSLEMIRADKDRSRFHL